MKLLVVFLLITLAAVAYPKKKKCHTPGSRQYKTQRRMQNMGICDEPIPGPPCTPVDIPEICSQYAYSRRSYKKCLRIHRRLAKSMFKISGMLPIFGAGPEPIPHHGPGPMPNHGPGPRPRPNHGPGPRPKHEYEFEPEHGYGSTHEQEQPAVEMYQDFLKSTQTSKPEENNTKSDQNL